MVIVGEGQTDKSTQFNKSPVAVSTRAKVWHSSYLYIWLFRRRLQGMFFSRYRFFFSIVNKPMELDYALDNAYDLIRSSTEEIFEPIL